MEGKNRLGLLHLVVLLGLMTVGFFLLFVASSGDPHSLLVRMLDHLAAALLIVGGIGVYEKWVTHLAVLEELRKLFRISESISLSGLEEILSDPNNFNFRPIVVESDTLTMVFNDGRKWMSTHFALLQERFARKGVETDIYIVHPDSPFVAMLADKTGDPVEEVKKKIYHALENLKFEYHKSGQVSRLRVFYLKTFPTHTVFLGNARAAITLYTIAGSRERVPVFEFVDNGRSNSVIAFLRKDAANFKAAASIAFDSSASEAG